MTWAKLTRLTCRPREATTSVICATGWTGSTEKSSALSRLPTPILRRRFIARPMVSSPKRSTKCRRGHETAPHSRRCEHQRCPADGSSGCRVRLRGTRNRSVDGPGSLSYGEIPQSHGRQEGWLFDLGRLRRDHLHCRAADGCHGSALCEGRSGEDPCDRCRASRSTGLCTRPAWAPTPSRP